MHGDNIVSLLYGITYPAHTAQFKAYITPSFSNIRCMHITSNFFFFFFFFFLQYTPFTRCLKSVAH